MNSKDIAIIGAACVFPGADGLHGFWKLIINGKDPKEGSAGHGARKRANVREGAVPSMRAGGASMEFDLPRRPSPMQASCEGLPGAGEDLKAVMLSLTASALADAGVEAGRMAGKRVDVVTWRPSHGGDLDGNKTAGDLAGHIIETLGLTGVGVSLENGFSAFQAIAEAVGRLREGLCDVACVGAAESARSATVVVLMRGEDMPANGVRAYARLKEIEAGIEPSGRGGRRSISGARKIEVLQEIYSRVGVEPETIGYLEVCNNSEGMDMNRAGAMRDFWGRSSSSNFARPRGSVGYLFDDGARAGGMASFLKAALCLGNKIIPPGPRAPEMKSVFDDSPFYANQRAYPWIHSGITRPRRAAVDHVDRDGTQAHVILEEVAGAGEAREIFLGFKRETELVVFSGASHQDLMSKIRALDRFLESTPAGGAQLEDVAYTQHLRFDQDDPYRIALVCKDIGHLREQLATCSSQLSNSCRPKENGDIYCALGPRREVGKTACIFPGMTVPGLLGSYPDRLWDLCLHLPEVRQVFDMADRRPGNFLENIPIRHFFFPPEYLPKKERNWLRQSLGAPLAVIDLHNRRASDLTLPSIAGSIANWANWMIIQGLRIPIDVLFGHSMGEYNALCAAEAVDFDTIIDNDWEAAFQQHYPANPGRLALVNASEEQLEPILDAVPEKGVSIAVYVAPSLQLIGGDAHALRNIAKHFQKSKIHCQILPYPAVHTPIFQALRAGLRHCFDTISIRKMKMPVYSAMRGDLIPDDPAEIYPSISENIDSPIRIWQTVHKMYLDGVKLFIPLGGGDSLYSQVRSNINSDNLTTISLDVDYRTGITQLNHLCAVILTKGLKFNLGYLFKYRSLTELEYPLVEEEEVDRMLTRNESPSREVHNGVDFEETRRSKSRSSGRDEELYGHEERDGGPVDNQMPFPATILRYEPWKEISVGYTLDINEDLYLRDHMFVHAPRVKPPSACLPVLPMAFGVEILAETAACLAPGYGLIGLEDVSASRWISLEDADRLPLGISARILEYKADSDIFKVRSEIRTGQNAAPALSGTVVLGKQYRVSVNMQFEELLNPKPGPLHAEQIYKERHLFHGPAFQCLSGGMVFGDQGMTGELTVLPTDRLFRSIRNPVMLADPVILDGVAQGLAVFFAARDAQVFPIGFRKLEIYRPTPPAGTRLPFRLQITELGLKTCYVNMEVQDGAGGVWMRMEGWGGWMFRWTKEVVDFRRLPNLFTVSGGLDLPFLPAGAVCHTITKAFLRDHDPKWIARSYLHASEMSAFEALTGNSVRRLQWLLGRVAAKDAVRAWLARRSGGEMLHPASFVIHNDLERAPYVADIPRHTVLPFISISHSGDCAIAIAHEHRIGVDIERIEQRDERFVETFTTPAERGLIDGVPLSERDAFVTSIWCAKEAVAKCVGTGVDGAPQAFEAIQVYGDGRMAVVQRGNNHTFLVCTVRGQDYMMALASNGVCA